MTPEAVTFLRLRGFRSLSSVEKHPSLSLSLSRRYLSLRLPLSLPLVVPSLGRQLQRSVCLLCRSSVRAVG